jgi:hypothetical protein
MLDRVLTVIKRKENKDYMDKFNELIQTSPLTDERLKEVFAQKTILGFLSHYDIHDYEDILSFEILKKLETSDLAANHLAGKYGLAVGTKGCNLEILQLKHPGCYFYCDLPSSDTGEHKWLEIPKEFRLETYELLPSPSKNRFKSLKS